MSNVKAYLEDIVRDGLHDIAEALKGSSPSGDVQASHVIYDNTESGLTSNRVQGAIDELSTKVDTNTSGISDLGDDVSDLTTRVGAAEGDITSLDGRLDTAEGDITSLDGRLDTAEGDITALETWKNNLDAGDIPYGSGTVKDALDGIKDSLTYSTSEHIVGEWIDGRPIYEKTVDCGTLPNNTAKIVPIGALGQDIFISLQGIAIRNDKAVTYDLSALQDFWWYVASTGVNMRSTTDYSSYNAYVTFRYVKP